LGGVVEEESFPIERALHRLIEGKGGNTSQESPGGSTLRKLREEKGRGDSVRRREAGEGVTIGKPGSYGRSEITV